MEVTVTLPLPARELHPNARVNRFVKAKITKAHREFACAEARKVKPRKPFAHADLAAHFYLRRRADIDGLASWLKATLDGIQDSGVIVRNDSDIEKLTVTREVGNPLYPRGAVSLCFTEVLAL